MKRIETKRPIVLGRPGRRPNPDVRDANFTPLLDAEIISRAEIQGANDGFPYLRDLLLVLFSLYGNGKLSPKLGRDLPQMIAEWAEQGPPPSKRRVVLKRNFKLRRDTYELALKQWHIEAPESARTATAMAAFLLDAYGRGKVVIALRAARRPAKSKRR